MQKEKPNIGKKYINEMEINNLFDKDFKVMAIKMFTKHGETMNEHSEILIKK